MATQPQIIANRQNALKSTGPKSQKGKAAVAQNALKHGLSARQDVIITESQEDFDLHRDSLLEELAPQGPIESMLADRLISLSWRLKRADLIQNQAIDAMNEQNTTNPLTNLAKSFGLKGLGAPHPEPTASNPDLTLGRIALKDFANARVLDRLLMYERRIENSLHKTILELQRLNLIRNLNPTEPNAEPEPQQARSVSAGAPTKPRPAPAPKTKPVPVPFIAFQYPTSDIKNMKNKPNPKNQKNTTTLATAKNYKQKTPEQRKENKPNQTQSRDTQYPIPHNKLDTYSHRRIISLQTLQRQRTVNERSLPKLT